MMKIIAIIVFVLGITFFMSFNDKWTGTPRERKPLTGVLLLLLAIGLSCVTFIPANTVGVKYSMISGTSEQTLSEGVAFVSPLSRIYKIDTTVQERTQEGVSVQTKDAQYVSMEVNIKYQVTKQDAFKVYKGYKTLEDLETNIIANYTQNALNEICVQYNVIDLLGEGRSEVVKRTEELLRVEFANEGVTFKTLTIKDIDAGKAIEDAIEKEATAKKAVETAKQELEKAKIDAETKLTQAEGEAKANAVKTKALTDKVLAEQWIAKWNGELPLVAGDDGVMIDINKLIENNSKEGKE